MKFLLILDNSGATNINQILIKKHNVTFSKIYSMYNLSHKNQLLQKLYKLNVYSTQRIKTFFKFFSKILWLILRRHRKEFEYQKEWITTYCISRKRWSIYYWSFINCWPTKYFFASVTESSQFRGKQSL